MAHPGTQHSYWTAKALEDTGLLAEYYTGWYYKPESFLGRLLQVVPRVVRGRVERQLRRRHHSGLPPRRVRCFAHGEILAVAASRLGVDGWLGDEILHWRNTGFDRWVAKRVATLRPAAVVAYNSAALKTLSAARKVGSLGILDQTIAFPTAAQELLDLEAECNPEFADSLPVIPRWWIDQNREEALLADLILTPSEYVRESLMEIGVPGEKVVVLPYGVDLELFQPTAKATDGIFRVCFVGQLSQRKGIKYLLEAMKRLCLPKSEVVLVGGIVGSGLALRGYADVFSHVPNVPRSEVVGYMQRADVFVYPSLWEGSALAIYEALACGVPVVTTPNAGSVVRDGMDGFVVPARDVEALAQKIALLYGDVNLRKWLGQNARKRAEQFGWNSYAARIADLLRKRMPEQERRGVASRQQDARS